MRTAMIILVGFAVWGVCLGLAKASGGGARAMTLGTAIFAVIWFLAAATNMWFGVTRAGYAFMEELPIFLIIFLLPVIVAAAVKWRFL